MREYDDFESFTNEDYCRINRFRKTPRYNYCRPPDPYYVEHLCPPYYSNKTRRSYYPDIDDEESSEAPYMTPVIYYPEKRRKLFMYESRPWNSFYGRKSKSMVNLDSRIIEDDYCPPYFCNNYINYADLPRINRPKPMKFTKQYISTKNNAEDINYYYNNDFSNGSTTTQTAFKTSCNQNFSDYEINESRSIQTILPKYVVKEIQTNIKDITKLLLLLPKEKIKFLPSAFFTHESSDEEVPTTDKTDSPGDKNSSMESGFVNSQLYSSKGKRYPSMRKGPPRFKKVVYSNLRPNSPNSMA